VTAAREHVRSVAGGDQVRSLLQEHRYADLQTVLGANLGQGAGRLDYLVAASPDRGLLAEAMSTPGYLRGVTTPSAADVAYGSAGQERAAWRLLADPTVVPVDGPDGTPMAMIVGGRYLDDAFVAELKRELPGLDATVFIGRTAVATTSAAAQTATPVSFGLSPTTAGADAGTLLEGMLGPSSVYALASPLGSRGEPGGESLVISISKAAAARVTSRITSLVFGILVLTVLGAAFLGFQLARAIARPLKELAAGADAIAQGNYEQHIEVRSGGEIGHLARSFNAMAERLSSHVWELRESREELKRALTRFGETLRATHDLGAILQVVFDSSMDALRAQRGALLLMTGTRDALRGRLVRGMLNADIVIRVGEGVAGRAASEGRPIRIPADGPPVLLEGEEPYRTAIAVPLYQQERVMGVVCLYDRDDGQEFSEADMSALISLADQAGVAIENVFLHERAKRLAITDGLTGIWNRRYFQMQFEQEIERSVRFRRPFTLVLLDIDNFKVINDTYGHQQGDSVLIELAARVKGGIRDIDVVARYGGEEFALILPETDGEGGRRLAEKIRALVESTPFAGGRPLAVTISAGVACFNDHGTDARSLEAAADEALYLAKSLGRNRVILYGEDKVRGLAGA
jgi:diguanylate cyclase (GGDEF)-like protein